MQNHELRGSGVALVTPFTSSGEVDFPALRKVILNVTAGGIDYLVALGTTGEPPTLTGEERKRLFEFILEVNNGTLPVVAGLGGNNTAALVKELTTASWSGFSAILSASPYYTKPSQEGIFRHYEALALASPLPLILYNVPSRTGSNISAETTLRLAREVKNIIGTKEASGNFAQFDHILRERPAGFLLISGDDGLALPTLSLGADGLISVVGNALPEEVASLVRSALAGNMQQARMRHHQLSAITEALFKEGSPAGVKALLSDQGLCGNYLRLPLVPVSDQLYTQISLLNQALKALNLAATP